MCKYADVQMKALLYKDTKADNNEKEISSPGIDFGNHRNSMQQLFQKMLL
jgi:hypothetical protein